MHRLRRVACFVAFATAAFASAARAQNSPDWTQPFPAFRIVDNLYYVGSNGLASYLIATPEGHILINSSLDANVPMIRASVEQLGFKYADIKVLLISHAHWDHNAGAALIKQQTGAKYMVMDADVPVVESGGKSDFEYGNTPTSLYTATTVDRALHDLDEVRLGGAVLVAHLTPGHTKGCTTWTMKVNDGGTIRNVVIIGSPNVNTGYKLVGNTAYPEIAADYQKGFKVLGELPVDYFLGAHGAYFGMEAKYAKLTTGGASPFIDPMGYHVYVAGREKAFRDELIKQGGRPTGPAAVPLIGCGRDIPGGGTIRGRLIPDSAGLKLSRGVFVDQCNLLSGTDGTYIIRGVPPGTYQIGVGDLGLRRVAPLEVRVFADSTSVLDIHLRPENPVLDCAETPACAPVMVPVRAESLPPTFGVEDRVKEAAFRTTIGLSMMAGGIQTPMVVFCLAGDSTRTTPEMIRTVQRRIESVRPATACEVIRSDVRMTQNRQEIGTGRRAWGITVMSVTVTGSTAESSSAYNAGPLWGAGWRCSYVLKDGAWQATRCMMTFIS